MKYGFVPYEAKKAIGVTTNQWLYLDMVRGLSIGNEEHGHYANAANSYYAENLDVSVKTIQNYTKALESMGFLKSKSNGHRKTTSKFNKLYLQARQGEKIAPMKKVRGGGEKIAPQRVKKLHGGGEKIAPNSNIDNDKDSNSGSLTLFDQFLKAYGLKRNVTKAQRQWAFLSMLEKEKAIGMAGKWADYFRADGAWETKYHVAPDNWLRDKKYNEQPPKLASKQGNDQKPASSYSLPKRYA